MRSILFHVTVLLLCFTRVFAQQPSPEDYKVYTAVFRQDMRQREDKISSVTIMKKLDIKIDDSWVIEMLQEEGQRYPGANIRTLYNDKMKTPIDTSIWQLVLTFHDTHHEGELSTAGFHLKEKINLTDSYPISSKNYDKDWKRYYKKYPHDAGIYSFSSVTYSADGKTAVVYHAAHCHSLCGHGHITVLEKAEDNWQVKFAVRLWAS
ncbi:hypothetical protein [Chitinophaga pinensis]|uniref:Uncharacterized protein n=1 Tax=Chitinophaga pinensis TaxID=79329 RepID=A0A5C6LTN4_9BACT|nr:hypothetical protein [Chitinophaga pinensis]TWV99936.1 hypothetical protein FEF09_13135 [Chitinophaga pinensis]